MTESYLGKILYMTDEVQYSSTEISGHRIWQDRILYKCCLCAVDNDPVTATVEDGGRCYEEGFVEDFKYEPCSGACVTQVDMGQARGRCRLVEGRLAGVSTPRKRVEKVPVLPPEASFPARACVTL